MPTDDFDAVVIGAGHNGLVTAAYLARAGMSTLLVEARRLGRRHRRERAVRRSDGQHLQLRPPHVPHHAGDGGTRSRRPRSRLSRGRTGTAQHDVGLGSIRPFLVESPRRRGDHRRDRRVAPSDVDGYRRYVKAAMPAVRMIFEAANEPPSITGLTRSRSVGDSAGTSALLRWSRRSACRRVAFDPSTVRDHPRARRRDRVRWCGGSHPSPPVRAWAH